MRALRGMSRKVLAKVSGISERYIAQLESGKGNVSIVLLRRVSDAMGAHLEDLLPVSRSDAGLADVSRSLAQGDAGADRAGQGSARRRQCLRAAARAVLRHRADRPARRRQIDARPDAGEEDRLELRRAQQGGRSSRTASRSPRSSRSTARKAFAAWSRPRSQQLLARNELMVLATGGGIVSEPLTFDLILSSFYTIWLKAEPEEHMARVRSQGDLRPMADDRSAMAELRNILLSREPLYARATAVVDTAGLSVDAAAARLIDAVRAGAAERGAKIRAAQRGAVEYDRQRRHHLHVRADRRQRHDRPVWSTASTTAWTRCRKRRSSARCMRTTWA